MYLQIMDIRQELIAICREIKGGKQYSPQEIDAKIQGSLSLAAEKGSNLDSSDKAFITQCRNACFSDVRNYKDPKFWAEGKIAQLEQKGNNTLEIRLAQARSSYRRRKNGLEGDESRMATVERVIARDKPPPEPSNSTAKIEQKTRKLLTKFCKETIEGKGEHKQNENGLGQRFVEYAQKEMGTIGDSEKRFIKKFSEAYFNTQPEDSYEAVVALEILEQVFKEEWEPPQKVRNAMQAYSADKLREQYPSKSSRKKPLTKGVSRFVETWGEIKGLGAPASRDPWGEASNRSVGRTKSPPVGSSSLRGGSKQAPVVQKEKTREALLAQFKAEVESFKTELKTSLEDHGPTRKYGHGSQGPSDSTASMVKQEQGFVDSLYTKFSERCKTEFKGDIHRFNKEAGKIQKDAKQGVEQIVNPFREPSDIEPWDAMEKFEKVIAFERRMVSKSGSSPERVERAMQRVKLALEEFCDRYGQSNTPDVGKSVIKATKLFNKETGELAMEKFKKVIAFERRMVSKSGSSPERVERAMHRVNLAFAECMDRQLDPKEKQANQGMEKATTLFINALNKIGKLVQTSARQGNAAEKTGGRLAHSNREGEGEQKTSERRTNFGKGGSVE